MLESLLNSRRRNALGAPLALAVLFLAHSACSKGEQPASAGNSGGSASAAGSTGADGSGSAEGSAQSAANPTSGAAVPAGNAKGAANTIGGTAAKTSPDETPIDPEKIPAVVAKIDGVEITKSDLSSRAIEARAALQQRGIAPPSVPTVGFLHKVLDDIISNRLLARDLSSQGKGATAAEIDQQVAAIRAQFPSEEAFEQSLSSRGFDHERLKREVAEGITVSHWVQQTVMPSIHIEEAELKTFYDANQAKMVEPEKTHTRHVLVLVDQKATPEERAAKKKKAEELRARIVGGADFAAVAKEASDDKQSGERGGDLGWFYRGQMVPAFEKVAFEQPLNKVSDVIETRFGYHVVEVLERKPETHLDFVAVHDRIEQVVKQRRLEETIKARVNELAKKAKIEILL